jgi:hypothetical protein
MLWRLHLQQPKSNHALPRRRSGDVEVGRQAQKEGADALQVRLAALKLLGDGVEVAKAALEVVADEDRRGAGELVGDIHRRLGLVDGEGGGQGPRRAVGQQIAARRRRR